MKHLLKITLLLLVFMSVGISGVHAQKSSSNELTAKIGNTPFKSENCLAFWNSNNGMLLIIGINKNEKISIHLKSEGRVYEKGFTKGEYYFAKNTLMLDNYSVDATYSNGETDWKDNDDEERVAGKVQITEISATQIKGTFYFDLTKKKYFDKEKKLFAHDKNDVINIKEGSFTISLSTK